MQALLLPYIRVVPHESSFAEIQNFLDNLDSQLVDSFHVTSDGNQATAITVKVFFGSIVRIHQLAWQDSQKEGE